MRCGSGPVCGMQAVCRHVPLLCGRLDWLSIDCGPLPETQTGSKLRPIVLLESLPNFAEAVALDQEVDNVKKFMEPEQLGAGTLDGNIILLRLL